MVLDSLQNYVNLVSGASKASRARASAAARGLLAQAGLEDAATDAQERISKLADDIVNASRANREMLENLIGAEVEKAANRLGFARAEQVDELQAQVAELRLQLAELTAALGAEPSPPPPAKKAAVKKSAATKSAATKSAATKSTATTGGARKVAAPVADRGAGDASVARAQTTKKSPAAKAAARKSPAEKAAARTSPAVTAAKRTSAAERAARRAVADPGPLDSSGEL